MKIILLFALGWLSCLYLLGLSGNPKYITVSEKYHIVQKGDTLEKISKKYDISVQKLKFYNDLSDSGLIAGQKVYLFPKNNQKNEYVTVRNIPACKYHIVRKGETLTRIAKMYDIYLFDLMEYNQLTDILVELKQKIWLEEGHFEQKSISEEKEIVKSSIPKREKTKKPEYDKIEQPVSAKKERFILPTNGIVTSEFGMRRGRPHKGIDIAAPAGTPIYAVQKGKVVFSGVQRGYGNVIMVEHDNHYITVYAHNETNLVRENDKVKQGQPIATVGSTGISTGSHLHFEIRVKARAVNPRNYLPDL